MTPESEHAFLSRAERYCALEDRCSSAVLKKMIEWGCDETSAQSLLSHLQNDGFVDDERFVLRYCESKIRLQKWGPRKILFELRSKGISSELAAQGMSVVPLDEQQEILLALAQRKWADTRCADPRAHWSKVVNFLLSRGFDYGDIQPLKQQFASSEDEIDND